MKWSRRSFAALTLLAARWRPALALEAGERAPELTAKQASGAPLRLAAYQGQVVYLDFWASWCGPCRKSFPWLNGMQAKHGAQGLRVIGMNVDQKREDADRFLAQVPAQFMLGFDASGATPTAFGVKAMPSSVLIDREGRVVLVHRGFREDDVAGLEARIEAALRSPR